MGETYRNRIKLASLSDRQVSRRIDVLDKNNFLILIKSKPYRNIIGKETKIFGLSFKGFLASLVIINLENTYLFKTYQKLIKEIISSDLVRFYTQYIKSSLNYILTVNVMIGIKFDNMPYVANWMDHEFDFNALPNHNKEILNSLKNNIDESYYDVEENIPNKSEGDEIKDWWYLREYWHHVIDKISERKNSSKILSEMRTEYISELGHALKRHYLEKGKMEEENFRKDQLHAEKLFRNRRKSTK